MEILTSQPSAELRARISHHLISFLPPSAKFDAAAFRQQALACIADVQSRGNVPILVGGSGMYIKALTHGIVDLPEPDPVLREELRALSPDEARARLLALDPQAPENIDFKNTRRVIRVLEIITQTGLPTSELNREWKQKETPDYRGLLLTRDRKELNLRIAQTVRSMFDQGVVDEVRRLETLSLTAEMAIGLRDIQALIRGECTQTECEANMTLATTRFAKRQLTWFRNQFSFASVDLTGITAASELLPIARQTLDAIA